MCCLKIRHIIDQVRDREIPQESLCDLKEHLDACPDCKEYLEESVLLNNLLVACTAVAPEEDEIFLRLEEQLESTSFKLTLWESISASPFTRPAMIAGLALIAVVVGVVSIYIHYSNDNPSFSDRKLEASMKHVPEGAVLMRTSDGREIIFLDPALEADGTADKIMKEMKEAMKQGNEPTLNSDKFEHASYK